MRLRAFAGRYAVCRLEGDAPLPDWFSLNNDFASLIRRGDELSLVVPEEAPPTGTPDVERDWLALEMEGPMEFELTGVLVAVATPLADAGVPIFALSTYDTDVVLVPGALGDKAIDALRAAGHEVDA